jgi:hypothetical protein
MVKGAAIALGLSLLVGVAPASDSLRVMHIGGQDTPGEAYDVALNGAYAYVADGDSGFRVFSVADRTHPTEVGHLNTPGRAYGLAVTGGYVCVAADTAGLRVISVADPVNPVEVGSCGTPGRARNVAVAGNYAYVADGTAGLRVISVSDPAHPVEVGYCDTTGSFRDVAISGNHAFVADESLGFWAISVSNPVHPFVVSYRGTPAPSYTGVAVVGEYAYFTFSYPGVIVFDVANPANPYLVGQCSTPGWANGLTASGDYVYVAADEAGLRVLSVSDPESPAEVGYYDLPGWANGVAAAGDYAYVAYGREGLQVFRFLESFGDLDIDPDSLDAIADTVRLRRKPGDYAVGEFVLANTSAEYNPDTTDGPSLSSVGSLSFTGALIGPGGTLDSILIPNLPDSLAQGQTVVCTLAVYLTPGFRDGTYSGPIRIRGKDQAGELVDERFSALFTMYGDLDVDNDSLDVIADTIRVRPRLVSSGPPPEYTEYALGQFVLANTSESYNPDTADGPSASSVDSLSFTGSLAGAGGTLDSILIPNLPSSLAQGQTVICTLAVYVPPGLVGGDYSGSVTITGIDSTGVPVHESFYAHIEGKLGDLDIDDDSLDVARETLDLHTLPAYSPYARARFMVANTGSSYNPDTSDGPSRSPQTITDFSAYLYSAQDTVDSIYLLNLPSHLDVGQAVECTLSIVLPVGTPFDGYAGLLTIDADDTLGYHTRDSLVLTVTAQGPAPHHDLDSLRVAPIPFKPYQIPGHDAIHFQGLTAGARVTVYDASGQSVWSATESGDGHLQWDAKVASGIYVYLVVAQDGASKVGKLSVIR